MIHSRLPAAASVIAAALIASSQPSLAQQSPQWFVPSQPQQAAPAVPRPAAPRLAPRPAAVPSLGQTGGMAPGGPAEGFAPEEPAAPAQSVQVQLPPAPEVPTLPKTSSPPAAIIGVLSAPDVMRASSAYQQADKEIGLRRQKLNEDAQKEQIALRELGQALGNERGKLSPEQIRAREKELQDRITDSRRKFSERNRIIQESGQYVMAQIDRTLEQVAQQVALSRGVNLVLNRALVLGSTNEFDLTPQVTELLNKILPSVVIPPDGVSPVAIAPVTVPAPNGAPNAAPGAAPGAPPGAAAAAKPAAPAANGAASRGPAPSATPAAAAVPPAKPAAQHKP